MSIAQVETEHSPSLAPSRRVAPLIVLEGYDNRNRTGTPIKIKGHLIKVYSGGFRYDILNAETGKMVELYP